MSYYRGDYYRGDFWSGLGKGIKRIGRDIGRAAKAVAPIAGIILPAVGAATVIGRGVTAAARIKKAGREARAVLQTVAPAPQQTPIAIASQLTGQTVGMPMPPGAVGTRVNTAGKTVPVYNDDNIPVSQWAPGITPLAPAPKKRRRRRRPQLRLRRTTRRTKRTTTRRRRRRSTRRS